MTEVLPSPALTLNHLMCSQPGSLSDLATHSPSCMVGPDAEPDSASRQDYHTPSLSSDMRYMLPTDDVNVRFTQEPGTSHSPVYSSEPAVPNTSLSSTLTFATGLPYSIHNPLSYQHTPSLSGSTYSSGGGYNYSPSHHFSMPGPPDIKPRLGSINSPGLGPLSRSPTGLPHPHSPITTRDLYTGPTPGLLRRTSELLSRSPSSSGIIRGVPLSPTSTSGFTSPISNMDSSLGGAPVPPLNPTEIHYHLETSNHDIIKPEIFGRIDKGFFQADGDWTCYRRNYFSLCCSYTLSPNIPNGSMYLLQPHSGQQGPQVHSFAMSIAAVVDGRDGKSIDLVQHTPKRDKGPQDKPARIALAPRPPVPHGMYGDSLAGSGRSSLYDSQGFNQNPNQPAMEANFERIQFKNATANNGKRRAAQQYYHLLVELFADIGSHAPASERWVKIASRMSAPMVVRGRSPGHYQSDRRGSNSSNSGPGSGAGGAGSYTPSGNVGRAPGDIGMSGTSSMMGSSYGHNSYDRSGHYGRLGFTEQNVTEEEAKFITGPAPYLYYADAMHGDDGSRHGLPSMSEYTTNKVKHEYSSPLHSTLPSLSSYDWSLRRCGPFEGVGESKGFYPTMAMQHELNIT